jgi:hypothetical protein
VGRLPHRDLPRHPVHPGPAGGGDRAGTAHVITADDLIAVQLLSVRVPARTALELLEGQLGHDLTRLLEQIPTTVDLGSPQAADLLATGRSARGSSPAGSAEPVQQVLWTPRTRRRTVLGELSSLPGERIVGDAGGEPAVGVPGRHSRRARPSRVL